MSSSPSVSPRRCDCTRTDSPEGEKWMPVAEHEALRAAAEGVFDASGGDALADALQRLGLVLAGEADDA